MELKRHFIVTKIKYWKMDTRIFMYSKKKRLIRAKLQQCAIVITKMQVMYKTNK